MNQSQLTTTSPANTPPGDYLVRIEQVALHVAGAPQWYISCAQINITGSGKGAPAKVAIPGYVSPTGELLDKVFTVTELTQLLDPGLTVNIYYPVPTAYKVSSLLDLAKN